MNAAKSFPKQFYISMAIVLLVTILNTFMPYLLRVYLNNVINNGDYLFLAVGIALFAVFLFIKSGANILWYTSLDDFGGRYVEKVNIDCQNSLRLTSLKNIDSIKPNTLKHIIYSDILETFRIIAHHIPSLLGSIAIIIMSMALSVYYNFFISVFILIVLIVGIIISFGSRKIISKTASQTNVKLKGLNAINNEFIDNITLVQTNNISEYYVEKTVVSVNDFISTAKKEDRKIYFWTGIVQNYNTLFTIALSALLAIPASGGSIVNLVFFTTLSSIIMTQGQKVESLIYLIIKSHVSFNNVDEVLHLPPRQGSMNLDPVNQIKFNNLSFAYDNTNRILNKINCTIQKGECIKLEGLNGSGKSTFIRLLLGLYDAQDGELLLNNRSISIYSQESINEQILYINQDESFLNEAVNEYFEVMTKCQVDSEIIKKYSNTLNINLKDRKIENNGQTLSVGQRKKLLIMKFILRYQNSSVIILDEINAGLDKETENIYISTLESISKNSEKIIIVVDHKDKTNLSYSKILKFSDKGVMIIDK